MTPIQLASMMATVANEGITTRYHPKKLRNLAIDLNLRKSIKRQSTKSISNR
jgi:cell division protein FtsI/penicillin-binding protein 2